MHRLENEQKKVMSAKRPFLYGFNEEKAFIQKYFPKYMNKVEMEEYCYEMVIKHKRAKIIKKLHFLELTSESFLQSLIILANKTKTLQRFEYPEDPKQIIQGIRRFPFVKAIKIPQSSITTDEDSKTPEDVKKEMNGLYRVVQYMKGMPKLELIEISFDDPAFSRILKRLDSLKDLKNLKIAFSWENSSDQKPLFDSLFEAKNLLNYVADLELGRLDLGGYEMFKELPEKCQNVRRIALEIKSVDDYDDDDNDDDDDDDDDEESETSSLEGFQVDMNYLETFESFQKLTIVDLKVEDVHTFIKDFALPMQIKQVKLEFTKNSWEFEGNIKEDPVFMSFFERWRNLKSLENLEIDDYEKVFQTQSVDFCQELLKRVPKLKEMRLLPGDLSEGVKAFDIAEFFKPLEHINKELESLEIGLWSQTWSLGGKIDFRKLERLKLNGTFQEKDLKNYFGLLKNSCLTKKKKKKIGFKQLGMSSEDMFRFLKTLQGIQMFENFEVDLEFNLQIMYPDVWLKESLGEVKKFVESSTEMKNVSLKIETYSLAYEMIEILQKAKLFKNVDFESF